MNLHNYQDISLAIAVVLFWLDNLIARIIATVIVVLNIILESGYMD